MAYRYRTSFKINWTCRIAVHVAAMTKSGGAKKAGRMPKKQQVVIVQQPAKKKKNKKQKRTVLNAMLGRGMGVMGNAAIGMLGKISGMGDYTVKSNSIATSAESIAGEVPHFGKADNSTRVRHREFIADIKVPATPANFSLSSYIINPSNKDLFPWLNKFAENYQQYKVHGMVIYFKSTTSDYSAAGALGKIAMATNYNVRDSAYANMQELENSEFAVSGKPSTSRLHPIECAPNNGVPLVKWVRDLQYDASGGDDRLYDVGKFQFATQGLPGTANTVIGELWVTYDIEFYKPIVGRDAPAVQYTPVSLPVFDTRTGAVGAQDLYMIEQSRVDFTVGSLNQDQKWNFILNPQKFYRVSGAEIDSSKLCYSQDRSNGSDIANPNWPASWETIPQSTTGGVSREHGRLTLSRPGIWYLRFAVKNKSDPTTVSNAPDQRIAYDPIANSSGTLQPPNNYAATQYGGMDFELVDAAGLPILSTPNVLTAGLSGGNTNKFRNETNTTGTLYVKRDALSWSAVVWLPNTVTDNGGKMRIKFRPPQGYVGAVSQPVSFPDYANQTSIYDPDNLDYAVFEIGLVNVATKTYYEPVEQGFTKDDDKKLSDGVKSVLALLPKLRELGIEC